jgi:hypothetical protein
MQDSLIISFAEEYSKDNIVNFHPVGKRIFNWLCYTLNEAGYVPHIFECTNNEMIFVLRRISGSKKEISFHFNVKMVMFANNIFRINQPMWPVRCYDDTMGGKHITCYKITCTGKERPINKTYEESVAEDKSEDVSEHDFV